MISIVALPLPSVKASDKYSKDFFLHQAIFALETLLIQRGVTLYPLEVSKKIIKLYLDCAERIGAGYRVCSTLEELQEHGISSLVPFKSFLHELDGPCVCIHRV